MEGLFRTEFASVDSDSTERAQVAWSRLQSSSQALAGRDVDHLAMAWMHLKAAFSDRCARLCGGDGEPAPEQLPVASPGKFSTGGTSGGPRRGDGDSFGAFDETVTLPTSAWKEKWDMGIMILILYVRPRSRTSHLPELFSNTHPTHAPITQCLL